LRGHWRAIDHTRMAKRPESRWFLVGAVAEVGLAASAVGICIGATIKRHPAEVAASAVVAVVAGALGIRGLYRWRVREKNGHIGQ